MTTAMLFQKFAAAVGSCDSVPAAARGWAPFPIGVQRSKFDRSYLAHLDEQIELNARGDAWNERLRRRRAGLEPICDRYYLSGDVVTGGDEYRLYVDDERGCVVFWEVYEQVHTGFDIRPMSANEVPQMINYFHACSEDDYYRMGVDSSKLPDRSEWIDLLQADFKAIDAERKFYYLAWVQGEELIGHCNINQISFGQDARVHLHVWKPDCRRRGLGRVLFNKSIAQFAKRFELERLFCEPHVENPVPNQTIPHVGFQLAETIETTPGWINFHQTINRYCREFWR